MCLLATGVKAVVSSSTDYAFCFSYAYGDVCVDACGDVSDSVEFSPSPEKCYDLRFPELSTMLSQSGADILTFPSSFTQVTGAAHWETLLRARAIENQCYVIAAAQVGDHQSGRSSYGHSMVCESDNSVKCPHSLRLHRLMCNPMIAGY